MEQTDMDKNEKTSGWWVIIAGFIGALVGGIGYLPIISLISSVLDILNITYTITDWSSDGMFYLFMTCLFASGLGAMGGLLGGAIAHIKFKRFGTLIGGVLGGMVVAIIIDLLVPFSW